MLISYQQSQRIEIDSINWIQRAFGPTNFKISILLKIKDCNFFFEIKVAKRFKLVSERW